ncbi:MAG TPA: sigma-70 family RNA polymerase sigma factor [Actinomycetota bacterium]|jgi:RNA polymerase sigma-70 factor (ECF subfamily)|nr:sigma-70 family RNA polymerase sigma factor [Actinomycetota bacterium]
MTERREEHEQFLHATMGTMDLVYNLARRFTDRSEDTEDLVQETYLAAYRAWREHRRPRRVEPWIATICLNLARSRYRTKARRPIEVAIEGRDFRAPEVADPEQAAEAVLEQEALRRAMRLLPEEQRVAITLVDLGGLSTTEAAGAMGTPRGTVLSRLHRGRRGLAALLWAEIRGVEER